MVTFEFCVCHSTMNITHSHCKKGVAYVFTLVFMFIYTHIQLYIYMMLKLYAIYNSAHHWRLLHRAQQELLYGHQRGRRRAAHAEPVPPPHGQAVAAGHREARRVGPGGRVLEDDAYVVLGAAQVERGHAHLNMTSYGGMVVDAFLMMGFVIL